MEYSLAQLCGWDLSRTQDLVVEWLQILDEILIDFRTCHKSSLAFDPDSYPFLVMFYRNTIDFLTIMFYFSIETKKISNVFVMTGDSYGINPHV